MLNIRTASIKDAVLIAHMHATSWKDAYKNILPNDYLEDDLESERERHWNKKMNELAGNDFVLIAQENKRPVGFISVWQVNNGEYDAFVDNLHVLPVEKGKGIGLSLIIHAAEKLIRLNKKSFYLWVFDQNTPARRFYERTGGKAKDKSMFEIRGKKIPETRYVWTDLSALVKLKPEVE
jgi:predicted N-acetyltransferase YhbS